MGNYSAPDVKRGSKIYRMASTRNHRVLITSLAVLVFGILALYDSIVRPGAQTPISIICVFAVIGISLYGFYLSLTRSRDVFRHPDVKKFLSFGAPRPLIELFEQEAASGDMRKFRNAFITRSFLVSETFYRFRWAYSREIKLAYVEPAGIGKISIPFIGAATVVVHLGNGTSMHIKCDSIAEAEALLMALADIVPSAHFVPAGPDDSEVPVGYDSEIPVGYEASARYIVSTISQAPETVVKSTPMAKAIFAKPEPVRPKKLSKEELFNKQIKDLYDMLDKKNVAASLAIIQSIGDTMNTGAVDILVMLFEYPDEKIRAQAAFTLGTLGQQLSVEPLIRALEDSSAQVRENAAIALGKIGDLRAVAPLQQVPTSDIRVKKAAVGALARIDKKLNIFNKPGTGFFNTLK